ncbi:DUF4350 domain-containing protein [Nesterenkonia sp. HG001]|uniref:DUF4350 domain-containing protein n=1 Tax=Nesterenkonia sp. HG001 TaxID=2983207 RepID=UPI002AC7D65C|nr:DUF4350 domain-containing protein [Nesterenkonia sp. HG001]MDZ5076259.1 hypothetical protein [Nesterenkonia sp. HG001]
MTAQSPARSSGGATVQNFSSALRTTLRRWQFWLLLVVLGVLFAVVVQLLTVEDQERYGLSNTDLDGYAAVAAVLQDEGVDIHHAPTAEIAREHLEQLPDAAVVVLEQGPEASPRLVEELAESTREIVWISPTASTRLSAFEELRPAGAIPASSTTELPELLETGEACSVAPAERAEAIRAPGQLFTGGTGCFVHDSEEGDSAHALAETGGGLVFGAPEAFTNRHITSEGNAALALGLFGQQQDLIWYTPSGMDSLASDEWASPWDFMPDWVDRLTWWLLICTLLLMLVAGRRHGPVVIEPLPVEVPASESAEGRGRLYQQADAASEAARTLRSAHLLRLTRLLRLGPGTPEQHVIAAVAAQTGRPPAEIAHAVDASAISGNSQMVRYAQGLAALEDEIRIRLGHGPRRGPGATASRGPQDEKTWDSSTQDETPREETL